MLWSEQFPEMALLEVTLPGGYEADAKRLYSQLHQPDSCKCFYYISSMYGRAHLLPPLLYHGHCGRSRASRIHSSPSRFHPIIGQVVSRLPHIFWLPLPIIYYLLCIRLKILIVGACAHLKLNCARNTYRCNFVIPVVRRIELSASSARATLYLAAVAGAQGGGAARHACLALHAVGPRARTAPAHVRVLDYYRPTINDTQVKSGCAVMRCVTVPEGGSINLTHVYEIFRLP